MTSLLHHRWARGSAVWALFLAGFAGSCTAEEQTTARDYPSLFTEVHCGAKQHCGCTDAGACEATTVTSVTQMVEHAQSFGLKFDPDCAAKHLERKEVWGRECLSLADVQRARDVTDVGDTVFGCFEFDCALFHGDARIGAPCEVEPLSGWSTCTSEGVCDDNICVERCKSLELSEPCGIEEWQCPDGDFSCGWTYRDLVPFASCGVGLRCTAEDSLDEPEIGDTRTWYCSAEPVDDCGGACGPDEWCDGGTCSTLRDPGEPCGVGGDASCKSNRCTDGYCETEGVFVCGDASPPDPNSEPKDATLVAGQYVLGFAPAFSDKPVFFLAELTEARSEAMMSVTLQPLALANGTPELPLRTVGDAATTPTASRVSEFGFRIDSLVLPAAATSLDVEIVLQDFEIQAAPGFETPCGSASGEVSSPVLMSLAGSTFALISAEAALNEMAWRTACPE